jgi:hypothetical protein
MTRPESDRVHTWFGLSYSNYQVLPRTLMQSMPDEWQHRMVDCLEELRDAYSHVEQAPGYEVNPVDWKYANELTGDEMKLTGATYDPDSEDAYDSGYRDQEGSELGSVDRVGVPVDEPVPHYNRGRAYVEPRFDDVARADGDGDWGDPSTWKPEVARAVEAMDYFDWTGFDPADRGHRAMLAAVVLNESDESFADVLPPSVD